MDCRVNSAFTRVGLLDRDMPWLAVSPPAAARTAFCIGILPVLTCLPHKRKRLLRNFGKSGYVLQKTGVLPNSITNLLTTPLNYNLILIGHSHGRWRTGTS